MVSFIHHDPKNRTLSALDRRTVRRVSSAAGVVTRKAKGPPSRINTLQLPDFLFPEAVCKDVEASSSSTSDDDDDTRQPMLLHQLREQVQRSSSRGWVSTPKLMHTPAFATPISLWPDKSGGALDDVAVLMQPGLSQKLLVHAASVDVNSDPKRWVKICRLTTILRFLPQMVGQSRCLDHAIDCLAERVRQVPMQPTDRQLRSTQLERKYGRALQGLQGALTSAEGVGWTVWYTTLLLALFELLEHSNHHAWILHSQGAKHILAALGPHRITTEFEKILLAAQCQIMTVEATFVNQECFLSHPSWQKALRSLINTDMSTPERSEPVITLWMITARAPGIYKRVTEVVMRHVSPIDSDENDRNHELATELCTLLEEYKQWGQRWERELVADSDMRLDDCCDYFTSLTGIGTTLLPIYLAYTALTNRFLVAIQPSRTDVAETNAVNAALRIAEIDRLGNVDSVTDLCRTFALAIGRSVKSTTLEWSMQQHTSRSGGTIEPQIFARWCRILDRTI